MIPLLLACDPSGPAPAGADMSPALASAKDTGQVDDRELIPLEAPRLLRRLSLDLRGTLPTVEELDAVEADPSLVDDYAAAFLDSPTTEDRLVSLLAERWHTVLDVFEVGTGDYGMDIDMDDAFAHAVGEEPLRLVARVVTEDRPYGDVVTSRETLANELLASIWPIDYPEGGSGWMPSTYTDGRPAAGLLSTNGFYWRYVTNASNKNRGRVAAISRLLLCTDILSRPVVFARSEDLDPESAVRSDPTCLACHAALDPVAAGLFGFWWTIQYNPYEMEIYHPERERLGPELLGTDPAWYGTPTSGLVDMGFYISRDPRFARCAAQSWAESLWRRPTTLDDFGQVENLRQSFVASGQSPRTLLLDVLATDEYRAGSFGPGATELTREREVVERLLSPNQHRMLLEDFAGLYWTVRDTRALENDIEGYRVLFGGVDGYTVTRPQDVPGLTWMLTSARVAQLAADNLVRRDFKNPEATVLTVPESARPGDDAFDEQLRALHWRLYATRATDSWVADMGALWSSVLAVHAGEEAWAAVIEAMLRDPDMEVY